MLTTRKPLIAGVVCLILVSLVAQPAFAAITLSGTVPVGRAGLVLIQANKQPKTSGVLKFKFSAPLPGPMLSISASGHRPIPVDCQPRMS